MSRKLQPRALSALALLRRPGAIWRYLRDPKTRRAPKLGLLLALVYVVVPVDLIPDMAPFIGWLDDLGLVSAATAWLLAEVAAHDQERA